MHFADNAVSTIRTRCKCIRVTSVAGYEFSSCVLHMLIKHMCGMWYKSPFWLDLVHVTGHIECDHLHYDRSWYWILQHNSTWWKVGDNFCCQSGISSDTVSERESTASGASAPDDKTTTIQYKPATSLTGNNNALANYEQSRGYDHLSRIIQFSWLVRVELWSPWQSYSYTV